jgi:hypothetical protein
LGARHAELARPLVREGSQKASYIIDQKSEFSAGATRAHTLSMSVKKHG